VWLDFGDCLTNGGLRSQEVVASLAIHPGSFGAHFALFSCPGIHEAEASMPSVVRLSSATIYVYADDHVPPHFHLRGPNSNAQIRMDTLEVMEGYCSRSFSTGFGGS